MLTYVPIIAGWVLLIIIASSFWPRATQDETPWGQLSDPRTDGLADQINGGEG